MTTSKPDPRLSDQRRGIVSLLGAAFWLSIMSALAKVAGRELPVPVSVFVRSAVTLVLSYGLVRHQGLSLRGAVWKPLFVRAAFGIAGVTCFYRALVLLPMAEATVIQYLNPLLATLLAFVALGERPTGSVTAGLVLGFGGILLVTRPAILFGTAEKLSETGVLIGLGGATLTACAYVALRNATRSNHPDLVALSFPLIAAPVTLVIALPVWQWPTARGWLVLAALGTVTHFGQLFMSRGLALVSASRGTAIGYLQVVFAAAWGALFFDELPRVTTAVGAILVVAAALLLMRSPRSTELALELPR